MTLGRIIALAAAASLACAHAAAPSSAPTRYAAVDDARLLHAAEDPDDWLTYGGTYLEERFSRLDGINVDNVSRLRPAWYFEADTTRGQEATPIVVDGVMYVTTAWSKVYALDHARAESSGSMIPKCRAPQVRSLAAMWSIVARPSIAAQSISAPSTGG